MIESQRAAYIIQWQRQDGTWTDQVIAVSLLKAHEEFDLLATPPLYASRWRIIHRATTVTETEIRRGE